eukprot:6195676-Pleurochrysis_carterae.AAC.1
MPSMRREWALSSPLTGALGLTEPRVSLNGVELSPGEGGQLPALDGVDVAASDELIVEPLSVKWVLLNARTNACNEAGGGPSRGA